MLDGRPLSAKALIVVAGKDCGGVAEEMRIDAEDKAYFYGDRLTVDHISFRVGESAKGIGFPHHPRHDGGGELSDRVALIHDKMIVAHDTPENLKHAYGKRVTKVRLSQ